MPEPRIEEIRERLRAMGSARDFRVGLAEFLILHPTRYCERCAGRGWYDRVDGDRAITWVEGVARHLASRDCGSCDACRGAGTFPLSLEEIRTGYANVRAAVVEKLGGTEEDFDAMARRLLPDGAPPEELPARWLEAARTIAREALKFRRPAPFSRS